MRLPREKASLLQGDKYGDFLVQMPSGDEISIPQTELQRAFSVSAWNLIRQYWLLYVRCVGLAMSCPVIQLKSLHITSRHIKMPI